MKYFIISPTYNSDRFVQNNIKSVKEQLLPDGVELIHIIINDGSTDSTKEVIDRNVWEKLIPIHKETRQGIMVSHLDGMRAANIYPESSGGVIIHLDGDDWFNTPNAISRIHKEYLDTNCWASYGNYVPTDPSFPKICGPTTDNDFRNKPWKWSHPRTFRLSLISNFTINDFVDENSNLYSSATDTAIFLPILEWCGKDRIRFIDEELVVYNRHNPLSEDKIDLHDQIRCARSILSKPSRSAL